jgi:two-component system, chemotaxis family, CheB/CheR fusion protein
MMKKKPAKSSVKPRSKPIAVKNRAADQQSKHVKSFPIVGMGASAGGLEAFEQFFKNMPPENGMVFILVPHLDPSHASMMTDLMTRFTTMKAIEAQDGMPVEPNHLYVIPPNKDMALYHGKLQLSGPETPRGLRMPIDFFFRSLAEDQDERAIAVILSGTGRDGTMGMRAIHGAGGMVMVQDPATAKYDGMPRSAVETGLADYVLPVEKMPRELIDYSTRSYPKRPVKVPAGLEKPPKAFEKILMLLRSKTGHDFSLYKRNTLHRRIERRMNLHNIEDISNYVRYLQEQQDEVHILFKELLITVTSFFRDHDAFEVLKTKFLPRLVKDKPEDYVFRAWVPGCASGEEAYSIAMVLKESFDDLKRGFGFQIFGTDLDEDAINAARAGIYPANIAMDVAPERLKRFFIKENDSYRIKKEIRESMVFAVQNLAKDAPFTRLDLLSCRNLLIYLESELQNQLIPLFHYSLKPDGILFLGSSESIGGFADLFSVLDRKWKFFQRKPSVSAAQAVIFTGLPTREPRAGERAGEVKKGKEISLAELAHTAILEDFSPPCVIINEKSEILYVQGGTGKYLEAARGQASHNILEMAREGLRYEMRSAIYKALSQKKEVTYRGLKVKTNGSLHVINLTVRPFNEPEGARGLMMVVFEDIGPEKQKESIRTKGKARSQGKRVEELERELRHMKESQQATIEEIQASNEELKSTNEEMQSTNEEFQSTNEELETSREELQSVNEELTTLNSEFQGKIEQLSRAENDMKNLLDSTNIGIIYLDRDLNIKRFTNEATKIVSLLPSDIGRPISHLMLNLKYENLLKDAGEVLATLSPKEMEVQAKDDRWYLVRIMIYQTIENVIDGVVITLTGVDQLKQTTEKLKSLNVAAQSACVYAESIVDAVRDPLLVLDRDLRVVTANRSFYTFFGSPKEKTERRSLFELADRKLDIPKLRELLKEIVNNGASFEDFAVDVETPRIGRKKMLLNAHRMVSPGADQLLILLAMEDITKRKPGEKVLES